MATNSSNHSLAHEMDKATGATYEAVVVAMIIIVMVFGIPLNACTAFVFHFKFPRTAFNTLVVGMAMYDFLSCAATASIDLAGVVSTDGDPGSERSFALCRALTAAIVTNSQSCMIALLAVTVLRYRGVCHPLGWKLTTRHTRVILVTAIVFSAPCGLTQSKLFVPSRSNLSKDTFVVDCVMDASTSSTAFGLFTLFMLIGAITGIFLVQGILNSLIVKALWFRNRVFPQPFSHPPQRIRSTTTSGDGRTDSTKAEKNKGSTVKPRHLQKSGRCGLTERRLDTANDKCTTHHDVPSHSSPPNRLEDVGSFGSEAKYEGHCRNTDADSAKDGGKILPDLGFRAGQVKSEGSRIFHSHKVAWCGHPATKSMEKRSLHLEGKVTKNSIAETRSSQGCQQQQNATSRLPRIEVSENSGSENPSQCPDDNPNLFSPFSTQRHNTESKSNKGQRFFAPGRTAKWFKNSFPRRGKWRTNPDTGEATSGEPSTSISEEQRSASGTISNGTSSSQPWKESNENCVNSFAGGAAGGVHATTAGSPQAPKPVGKCNRIFSAQDEAYRPISRTEMACRLILAEIKETCAESLDADNRRKRDIKNNNKTLSTALGVLGKAPSGVTGVEFDLSRARCQESETPREKPAPKGKDHVKTVSRNVSAESSSLDTHSDPSKFIIKNFSDHGHPYSTDACFSPHCVDEDSLRSKVSKQSAGVMRQPSSTTSFTKTTRAASTQGATTSSGISERLASATKHPGGPEIDSGREPTVAVTKASRAQVADVSGRALRQLRARASAKPGPPDRYPRWLGRGEGLRQRSLKRSVVMMLVLLTVYAFSTCPAVLLFFSQIGWMPKFVPDGRASVTGRIMFRCCYITNVAGPVVFGVWNAEYRREMKKLWSRVLPATWR